MSVDVSGNVHFALKNGESRTWTNLHLHPSKHPHTVTDVFLGKVVCGKCGTVYHRSNGKNRWCYWKCYGKQKHICDNVNFTDYMMRHLSKPLTMSGEMRPTDVAAVLAPNKDGRMAVFPMLWGFSHDATDAPIVNCRLETADQKEMWKDSFLYLLCPLPVTKLGFYFSNRWHILSSFRGKSLWNYFIAFLVPNQR